MGFDSSCKMPEPITACVSPERAVSGVVGDMLNSLRNQMGCVDDVLRELHRRLQPVLTDVGSPPPPQDPQPTNASPLFKELYDITSWAVMKHKELTLILERLEI